MPNKYIVSIGAHAVDYYYDVEGFPTAGDFTHAVFKGTRVGGCVCNCAAVMAAHGQDVYHLDCLKENEESTEIILSELRKRNIHTDYVKKDKNAVNCSCLIMCHESEKTIYVVSAVTPCFKDEERLDNLLSHASYIYTLMNVVHDDFDSLEPLKRAKENGTKIIFDGGSYYKDSYEIDYIYKLSSGVFMNAQSYARLKEVTGEEPYVKYLREGGEFMCVTDGSKGAYCYSKDGIFHEEALKIEVVDSTGAGDSFAGAFIASLNRGLSYAEALRYATANGAYACTKEGGMSGGTDIENLKEFAHKHNLEL